MLPLEKNTEYYEYCRFMAKVIIQLIAPKNIVSNIYWVLVSEYLGGIEDFQNFVLLCWEKKYPWSYVKDIVEKYYESNEYYYFITYSELMEVFPCIVMTDNNKLETICDTVINDNSKSVMDYRKGKINSINHLKGQVMRLTGGQADVKLVTEILERKLKT